MSTSPETHASSSTTSEQLKRITLCITAPGSEGAMDLDVTPEVMQFLIDLAISWNELNPGHAQPTVEIMWSL